MKLFKRHESRSPIAPDTETCHHLVLSPAWDNLDDMGSEERASRFTCMSCQAEFSPGEAAEMRATEARRIREEFSASR